MVRTCLGCKRCEQGCRLREQGLGKRAVAPEEVGLWGDSGWAQWEVRGGPASRGPGEEAGT